MELFNLLLSDWVGRLSLFTVLFCIGMAVFFGIYFTRQVMKADKANRDAESLDNDHVPHA